MTAQIIFSYKTPAPADRSKGSQPKEFKVLPHDSFVKVVLTDFFGRETDVNVPNGKWQDLIDAYAGRSDEAPHQSNPDLAHLKSEAALQIPPDSQIPPDLARLKSVHVPSNFPPKLEPTTAVNVLGNRIEGKRFVEETDPVMAAVLGAGKIKSEELADAIDNSARAGVLVTA